MIVSAAPTPTLTAPQRASAPAAAPVTPPAPADVFAASGTSRTSAKPQATMPARLLYTAGCGVVGVYAGIAAFGGPIGALGGAFGAYYGFKNADGVSLKGAAIVAGATVAGTLLGGAVAGGMGQAAGSVIGFVAGETLRHKVG